MKGIVVAYISSKKYGFINGEDGESYFLHFSSLLDKSSEYKLIKGAVVEFDPIPTPKGLAAKDVCIQETYVKKKMVEFFITKQKIPKGLNVEASHPISTHFFKDPSEGREYIKQLAIEAGANAILGIEFEKNTFSEGNYKYTVHAFKGDFAFVSENVPCSKKRDELESALELDSLLANFNSQFKVIEAREHQLREKQLKTSHTGCFIALIILFVIIMFIFSR
ncbi:cold-shock protein [Shewanella polaris]|uniref:Cold shock domain-containing protein n=1 Tax=Shewanella polaris TaxID=2588449 RepID=A0A4Y5YC33_9GAMM|nr:cold shock domain-containing protein [Shewanella polaris]QDE30138.1 cold shock domain-containing protein [Shewanella polaris]